MGRYESRSLTLTFAVGALAVALMLTGNLVYLWVMLTVIALIIVNYALACRFEPRERRRS